MRAGHSNVEQCLRLAIRDLVYIAQHQHRTFHAFERLDGGKTDDWQARPDWFRVGDFRKTEIVAAFYSRDA